MFQIKLTIFNRQPSIIVDEPVIIIAPGRAVVVNTLCYGAQVGIIERITLSPFYPESEDGVQRAYVVGQGWSDYILLDDLLFADDACDCTDCDKTFTESLMCGECGYCLGCCDCTTEDIDALKDDYQPPQMFWEGRWFPESID